MLQSQGQTLFMLLVFCHNLCRSIINHLKAAKRILRYIKGTINYGLIYDYDANLAKGYCDADWAGSPNDRRNNQ